MVKRMHSCWGCFVVVVAGAGAAHTGCLDLGLLASSSAMVPSNHRLCGFFCVFWTPTGGCAWAAGAHFSILAYMWLRSVVECSGGGWVDVDTVPSMGAGLQDACWRPTWQPDTGVRGCGWDSWLCCSALLRLCSFWNHRSLIRFSSSRHKGLSVAFVGVFMHCRPVAAAASQAPRCCGHCACGVL